MPVHFAPALGDGPLLLFQGLRLLGEALRGEVDLPRLLLDLSLAAFNRAGEPKRLELYPGGHFSAYTDRFDRAAKAATEWFTQHLRP